MLQEEVDLRFFIITVVTDERIFIIHPVKI